MRTPKVVYRVHVRYSYLSTELYPFLLDSSWWVLQKQTDDRKIEEIILIFYFISILSLSFDENSGVEEMNKKSKSMTQHNDRSVIKHMIKI